MSVSSTSTTQFSAYGAVFLPLMVGGGMAPEHYDYAHHEHDYDRFADRPRAYAAPEPHYYNHEEAYHREW